MAAAILLIVTVLSILGVEVYNLERMQMNDSSEILTHLGNETIFKIDATLSGIEKAVESVYLYVNTGLDGNDGLLKNSRDYDVFIADMRDMVRSVAENTDGVMTAYLRFDPSYELDDPGFLLIKNKYSSSFSEIPLTDITLYSQDDVSHVGWYYLPIKAGKACWLDPYKNENLDIQMITYVQPLFIDDKAIGIVGMDVDMGLLQEAAADIALYDTGYAFIYDRNLDLVYHPDFPLGEKKTHLSSRYTLFLGNMETARDTGAVFYYAWNGNKKAMYAGRLTNGMSLGICVPVSEIASPMYSLIIKTVILTVGILLLAAGALYVSMRTIIRPLEDITRAAQELTGGNLDVELEVESEDELGILSDSLRSSAKSLKRYFEHFHGLAYTDELTHLNNKTAYGARIEMLNDEMRVGRARFAVVVADINDLKKINDNFGHDRGDILIQGVASILKSVFGQSSCYRTGGDEFAMIVTTHEVGDIQKLIDEFEAQMNEFAIRNEEIFGVRVSTAIGYSPYIRSSDQEFSQVFRRADTAMYGNKHEKKGTKHTNITRM